MCNVLVITHTHALAIARLENHLHETLGGSAGGSGDGDDLWRPPSLSLAGYVFLPSITQKSEMGSARVSF